MLGYFSSLGQAYPPAPFYQIYGTVRDEMGTPLSTQSGIIILSGIYSAYGTATVSDGSITSVEIVNGGSGFTSVPEVTFCSASGANATGEAIVTNGVVTGVNMTNGGSGYSGEVMVGMVGGGAFPIEVVRSFSDTSIAPGVNYSLSVPMDADTLSEPCSVLTMRPLLPFTIRVLINGVNYVPMQIAGATSSYWTQQINQVNDPSISVSGDHWAIGLPAGKLRLDLWLGVDANGDGLPDSWQWNVVNSDPSGQLTDYTQVLPDADFSGNGMTNMQKFIAGVYALEVRDGLHFQVDSITGGIAKLHFQAIAGRTYHLESSSDLINWKKTEAFSLFSDGHELHEYYLSNISQVINVYVPLLGLQQKYFKLYVQ
jgi:hypothetical protein